MKKVVKRPAVWGVFLVSLLMNIVVVGLASDGPYHPQSYRALWEGFERAGVSVSDALRQERELEFEAGDTDRDLHERYMRELENLETYQEYRAGILRDAERMQGFSVFANNRFASENVERTAEHFRALPRIEVAPGPSLGVEKFFSRTTAVFSMLFLFFTSYVLFIWEREKGLCDLLSVTKRGKVPLCMGKLAAHAVVTAFHAACLYAVNFLVLGYQYGFGDMQRSIQSVPAYRSCGYTLTVGSFLAAGTVTAILLILALAFVVDLVCILCGDLIHSAVIVGLLAGVSVLADTGLALNSSMGWIKYISPAFCLDVGEVLGKYVNMDFFGRAVYYPAVIAVGYAALAAAAFSLCCLTFGRNAEPGRGGRLWLQRLRGQAGRTGRRQGGNGRSVFRFEWKKICRDSHVFFLLAVFLLLSLMASWKERLIFEDEDEYYYYTYMEQVAGERTEKTDAFLDQTSQEFDAVLKERDSLAARGGDTEGALEELGHRLRPWNGFQRLLRRDRYLRRNGWDVFVYDTGLKELVSLPGNGENKLLFMLSLLLLTLLLSPVFAADREKGMGDLLQLTARSDKRIRSKVWIAMLLTATSFLVIYVPQCVTYLRFYGTAGFLAPVGCIGVSTVFGSRIPVCVWLAWHYTKVLARMLLAGGGILLLSGTVKRVAVVIAVLLAGLVVAGVLLFSVAGYLAMM